MKIIKRILFVIISLLFSIGLINQTNVVASSGDLDYIHEYIVKVDPRYDGTLDIEYRIKWEVLNDTKDGPLTWIVVGIPNVYVDELTPLSSNIKKIKYTSEDGSHIRIDFDRAYKKGEILDIKFKIHQSRMYFLEKDECYYDFNPGWFDEIKVGYSAIYWNKANVIDTNKYSGIDGDYYYWQSALDYGQSIKVKIIYKQSAFTSLSAKLQYSDRSITKYEIILVCSIFSVIFGIIIASIIISIKNRDPYMSHRGFCGRSFYFHHHNNRRYSRRVDKDGVEFVNPSTYSGGGRSGGGCACACACACAGGGRAGCSRKDFYNTNIKTKKIIEVIDELS